MLISLLHLKIGSISNNPVHLFKLLRRQGIVKKRKNLPSDEVYHFSQKSLNKATSAPQGASQSLTRPEVKGKRKAFIQSFLHLFLIPCFINMSDFLRKQLGMLPH